MVHIIRPKPQIWGVSTWLFDIFVISYLTFVWSVILISASSLPTYQHLLCHFEIPSHSSHQINSDEAFTCALKLISAIFDV